MGLNMEKKKRTALKTPMSLRPEAREKKQQHSPGEYARRHMVAGWLAGCGYGSLGYFAWIHYIDVYIYIQG